MTVLSFSGGAGCGKTHQLILALKEQLAVTPLGHGQKVLAIAFMHGARIRLDERLGFIGELKGCYDCSTLDSLAWRIVRRWVGLAEHLGFVGLKAQSHDAVINAAGVLMEMDPVAKWVAATYPILVIDESQDLTAGRLRIVVALSKHVDVLAAADEFQCLDENLRPNPACGWLAGAGQVTNLLQPQRTKVQRLLDAAAALRSGKAPVNGKPQFQVVLASNVALAGTFLANAVGWYGQGKSVSIITPTDGTYARRVVEWVSLHKTNQGCGPVSVHWEQNETKAAEQLVAKLALKDANQPVEVEAAARNSGNLRLATDLADWMDSQRRCLGKVSFSKKEIEETILRLYSDLRKGRFDSRRGPRAMTVHGAKNREFDQVVVLWPAAAHGSEDQKRRLLYNAVTRAKERVLVLVQAKKSLLGAPFA